MTDTILATTGHTFTAENSHPSSTQHENEKRSYSIQDVPRLPHELTPLVPFVTTYEVDQRGPLFRGPGANRDTGKYKIRPSDADTMKKAKQFAMDQSVKYVVLKQQQQQQRVQLDIIKKQQALLLMCRIYVGSINFEMNEAMLKQAFQPFGPVKSVSLTFDPVTNRHKGFAFLEYELPEAAQLAMEQMNGVMLTGRNVKVGRPSNMPQAQPIIDQLTEEAKNYNRIYIASIHPDLTENDIQSVFEAFGKIKTCTLSKDSTTNKHKGYGFIEYETGQAAQDAISAMNLFDLGGQHLRVGKAITPPDGLFASAQSAASVLQPTATIGTQLQSKEMDPGTIASAIPSPLIPGALGQVGYLNGALAPTTVVPPYSGATTTVPMISTMLSPSAAIPAPIPQPVARSGFIVPSVPVPTQPRAPVPIPPPQIIIPPVPVSSIPQPTILEEPPIPVGLRAELEAQQTPPPQQQQQQYPSISLVLPKSSAASEKSTADDSTASLSQQEELSVKGREQRHLLMQKLNQRRLESRVCVLRNMVGPEDVDDDLQQEITEECSKYGEVIKVVIYTEHQGEDETAEQIVKIFVEFQTSKEAERTVESLNGRWFAGRMIRAELYDSTAYLAEDLSG